MTDPTVADPLSAVAAVFVGKFLGLLDPNGVEASYPGYARQPLTFHAKSWSIAGSWSTAASDEMMFAAIPEGTTLIVSHMALYASLEGGEPVTRHKIPDLAITQGAHPLAPAGAISIG